MVRPAAGVSSTVASRRAATRPQAQRGDSFPLAIGAVVALLIAGLVIVFLLNNSGGGNSTPAGGVAPATAAAIQTIPPPVAAATSAGAPVAGAPTVVQGTAAATGADVPRMPLDAFKKLYDNPATRPLIIDVRAVDAFDQGHITGAISFPESDIPTRVGELPKDKLIIAYCQ